MVPVKAHRPLRLTPEMLLYRGVSQEQHVEGRGLTPRDATKAFERVVLHDGTYKHRQEVTYGEPRSQGAHAHQWDSAKFCGPGLSFTICQAVARHFATHGECQDGVIYVASVEVLERLGCDLEDPRRHTTALQDPNEKEIIVVLPPGMAKLPLDMFQIIPANLAN